MPRPPRQARLRAGLHQRRQQLQQHLRVLPVPQERGPALHGRHDRQLRHRVHRRVRRDPHARRPGAAEQEAGCGDLGRGRH